MLTRNRMAGVSMVVGALLLATGMVGCSDIEVHKAWAPQAAVVPIGSSFAWMTDQGSKSTSGEPVDPQLLELIQTTVENGFIAKGYEKNESGPADFWIGCRMTKDVQGDAYSSETFEQYMEGTLVIYVADPKSRKWIWKAWAQTRINVENPPETKMKRLQQAVDQMLKSFPKRGESESTAEQ